MIFDKHLSLFDSLKIEVNVTNENEDFKKKGHLILSNSGAPTLNFGLWVDLSSIKDQTYFKCESSGINYHLIDCEVLDTRIIPRLIMKGGNKRAEIKKVHLLLEGVSQWMDFDGLDDEIEKSLESKTFNIHVEFHKKKLTISNTHWVDDSPSKANNLDIYTAITIETNDLGWTPSELISIISDIRTIFTLILGYSTYPEYILNECDELHSLYYINAGSQHDEKIKPQNCFFPSGYLYNCGKWQTIFENYFHERNNDYRKLWGRVSGMVSYEGFWEYEILAYVSLIDRYVSIYSDKFRSGIPKSKESKLRKKLRETVDEYQESLGIITDIQSISSSIKEQINSIKGATLQTFNDKFDFKLKESNLEIMKILDLTEADFNYVKKIRNSVAHGDEVNLLNEGDITNEMVVTNKFTLLLRYWCFVDLGLTHKDFICRLENWLNPLVKQARINQKYLDQVSGNSIFLETDQNSIDSIEKYKYRCLVIDYINEEKLYRINVAATDYVINNMLDSVEGTLKRYVNTNNVKNIACAFNAYLKSNGEVFKISAGACILNSPTDISSHPLIKDRFIEFDTDNNTWTLSAFEQSIKGVIC